MLLIRREFVERRRWMDDEEMSRFWNLCLFTPGINLIALTVLIGRKLGGPWGVVASLAGMLLPSSLVTCLLAVGFALVQHSTTVHAVLRGVIPATAGIMGVVGLNFARPLVERGLREGLGSLSGSIAIMLLSALALIAFNLPVTIVLVSLALLGIAVFTPWRSPIPRPIAEQPRNEPQP